MGTDWECFRAESSVALRKGCKAHAHDRDDKQIHHAIHTHTHKKREIQEKANFVVVY